MGHGRFLQAFFRPGDKGVPCPTDANPFLHEEGQPGNAYLSFILVSAREQSLPEEAVSPRECCREKVCCCWARGDDDMHLVAEIHLPFAFRSLQYKCHLICDELQGRQTK
jgi:hypothetical protein